MDDRIDSSSEENNYFHRSPSDYNDLSSYNKNNTYNNNSSKNEEEGKGVVKNIDHNSMVLKVENVSKVFDSPAGRFVALRKINFTIKKGEFVSIVGPSGSGKSTLLNIIGALDRPSFGKLFVNNIDVFSLSDGEIARFRNNLIGFIFQSFNLINRSTVLKNVELPNIIAGMKAKERRSHALKLLEILGIKDNAYQKPVTLSGGQQQRVAIARSLINNPAIILADEPTGNLDTKTGKVVFDLLKLLSNKYRRTIVFVTHNRDLAGETDRRIHLKDGRLEKDESNVR